MNFYNELARLYDHMIDFDHHLDRDLDTYRMLLETYPAVDILDAGCGTGLHSLIFARLGARVTGIDNSAAMIRRARKNAQRFRLPVQYHVLDFLEFGDHMTESFDALYSLGNSLVHLRDGSERLRALQNFNAVLRPEGMLCIQILNYDKILAERPEVISEKERPPYRFIRRYVYQQDRIKFALEIDGMPEKLLLEQDIFPFRSSDLQAEAENAGFNRVQLTGSLKLDPFMPQTSPNICLWAWKG